MRRYRSGFTFIELICVLAIIAILAAILFPVFAQAREKARQASCASNLQQLVIAMHLYAEDHSGGFPPSDDNFMPVFNYVKNNAIFRCPSDPTPPPGPMDKKEPAAASWEVAPTGMPQGMIQPFVTSYNYRGGLHNDDWGDIPFIGERVLIGSESTPPSWVPVTGGGARTGYLGMLKAFYHSWGANRATIDGSVKWIRAKFWKPINEAQKKQLVALREQLKRSGRAWPDGPDE